MRRLLPFILYPLSFTLLASCDSNSLNQSDANPFVIFAAQFAEGSVGSGGGASTPTTIPAASPTLPDPIPPDRSLPALAAAPNQKSKIEIRKSDLITTPW